MNALQSMLAIRNATNSARELTGDKSIGTEVKAGQVRVVRWIDSGKSKLDASPLTDWASIDSAIAYLDGMK